jgi:DnaJ family protein C protein 17
MAGNSKVFDRVKDLDLYALLGLQVDADERAIKKAYRRKARDVHPDKNPDNPNAAKEFHRLSDAYEVLVGGETRKAYDGVLKARKAAELRHRQLDAKRQKLKNSLEEREKAAKVEDELAAEAERRRRERKWKREEEEESIRKEMEEERRQKVAAAAATVANLSTKLKVRWKEPNADEETYDRDRLKSIFSKFGEVREVVVLPGKKSKRSGLLEMATRAAAESAARIEVGLPEAPLKVREHEILPKEIC